MTARSSCTINLSNSDSSKFEENTCWRRDLTLVLYPKLAPEFAKLLPKATFTIVRKYLLQRISSSQWIMKVEACNVGSFPRSVCTTQSSRQYLNFNTKGFGLFLCWFLFLFETIHRLSSMKLGKYMQNLRIVPQSLSNKLNSSSPLAS